MTTFLPPDAEAASALALSPERAHVLDMLVRAGPRGLRLQEVYQAEGAETKTDRDALKQIVTRLRHENGLVDRIGHGVYRAVEGAAALVGGDVPEGARPLPILDVRANMAGRDLVLDPGDESVTGRYFVDLTEIEGLPQGEGFVTNPAGDSMYPLFMPGAPVVFRRLSLGLGDLVDAYYLFRLDGVIMFKGLQRLPRRHLRIFSINEVYRDVELDLDDESVDFEVLAVVWGNFRRYYR